MTKNSNASRHGVQIDTRVEELLQTEKTAALRTALRTGINDGTMDAAERTAHKVALERLGSDC